jgi:hypothetical protein
MPFDLPVERRSLADLDYRSFVEDFAATGRPVVLTGVGRDWPARSSWSLDAFAARADPEEPVELQIFPGEVWNGTGRLTRARLGDVLSLLAARRGEALGPRDERYYLIDWTFHERNPSMLKDYEVPWPFDFDLSVELGIPAHAFQWLNLGEAGSGTPTHSDVLHSSAWLFILQGTKRWRLVPADQAHLLGRPGRWADLFEPDPIRFPGLAAVRGYETVLQAGELMFAPACCVHAVRNLELTLALTHNYLDLSNLAELFDAVCLAPESPLLRGLGDDWLGRAIGLGVGALERRGLADCTGPLLEHLRASLDQRLLSTARRAETLEAGITAARRMRA